MNQLKYIRMTLGSVVATLVIAVLWVSCANADTGPSPIPSFLPVLESHQALSLWAFCKLHWSEIGGAVFTLLFFASEYIGQNPAIEANSLFQLVKNFLKAKADQK